MPTTFTATSGVEKYAPRSKRNEEVTSTATAGAMSGATMDGRFASAKCATVSSVHQVSKPI
eukprot:scaffold44974_cov176-Amphora_coffeaeformis.AAC.4